MVFVHGIGSRDDTKRSWGRIPEVLQSSGIDVYYGNSQAWSSIEDNASILKNTILSIIDKTGCKKVNIIAHSKGGLDARYMISELDMEDKVSSLTTINTPHMGSEIVDLLMKIIPKPIYKWITDIMNKSARKMGDKNPDCMTCSIQLSTIECKKFNEKIKDSMKVYYQSFASSMDKVYSAKFFFPYYLIKIISKEKKNDGVVNEKSALWWKNKHKIPAEYDHEDVIDGGKKSKKAKCIPLFYMQIIVGLIAMGM